MVKIIAAEMGIAIGGFHFKDPIAKFEDGDIESTATQVEHSNFHVLVHLVQTIGKRCSGRLINDPAHFQTGNFAGFLGCLAL